MTRALWWLHAQTSVHVGSGEAASLVDLPVAREATTGYPYIPGSGLKGGLRDAWRFDLVRRGQESLAEADKVEEIIKLFGRQDGAGELLIGDARLLLLPMRSLNFAFVWATCPYLLRRYNRDRAFAGLDSVGDFDVHIKDEQVVSPDKSVVLWIEDFRLKPLDIEVTLKGMPPFTNRKAGPVSPPIVVVSDRLFGHFARRCLPIRTRNRLEPETKTVSPSHLWSEESLAPETVLYTIFSNRSPNSPALSTLETALNGPLQHIQIGGNETVGEGWFALEKVLPTDVKRIAKDDRPAPSTQEPAS